MPAAWTRNQPGRDGTRLVLARIGAARRLDLHGSDRSTLPQILNTGAFPTGIAALLGGYGILMGLKGLGVRSPLAWLAALSILSTGVASIWASAFHLPDPRHNPGVLGAGTFVGPLIFLLALWGIRPARAITRYLATNVLAFAMLVPVMADLVGVDLLQYGGLLQRVAAIVMYVLIGVLGYFLLRGSRDATDNTDDRTATQRHATTAPARF